MLSQVCLFGELDKEDVKLKIAHHIRTHLHNTEIKFISFLANVFLAHKIRFSWNNTRISLRPIS